MLSTLAVGLAAGVGVWLLAGFATVFILALLWVVESIEPKATELFTLKVKAKDPAGVKPKLDALLARYHLRVRAADHLERGADLRGAHAGRRQDRSVVRADPEDRSGEHQRSRRGRIRKRRSEKREVRSEVELAVVAEAERDAEVVIAQQAHRVLQLVLRRRADAHLIGLDVGLHLLQLLVLQVFHDLFRRFDRDPLLNLDDPPQRCRRRPPPNRRP